MCLSTGQALPALHKCSHHSSGARDCCSSKVASAWYWASLLKYTVLVEPYTIQYFSVHGELKFAMFMTKSILKLK